MIGRLFNAVLCAAVWLMLAPLFIRLLTIILEFWNTW